MKTRMTFSRNSSKTRHCRHLSMAIVCLGMAAFVQAAPPTEPEPIPDDPSSIQNSTAQARVSGTYWVGPGSDCTFDNIQQAIDVSGGDRDPFTQINIRVVGTTYSDERLNINLDSFDSSPTWHLEELRIIGGYSSCGGAKPPGNPRTTLNANGFAPFDRVFSISYQNDPELERIVTLEDLVITGGRVSENEGGLVFNGAGISAVGLPGKLSVQLRNTIVTDNQAVGPSAGGGIYVEASGPESVDVPTSPLPLLWLDDDSVVRDNSSEAEGGGIRCVNTFDADAEQFFTSHIQTGNTLIRGNSALHGGGLSLQGCRATVRAGGSYFFSPTIGEKLYTGGIMDNFAINRGGGIHTVGGGLVQVHGVANDNWGGDPAVAAWIYRNSARRGGGIYAFGENTGVRVRDAWIEDNEARIQAGEAGLGGGIYVGGTADLLMERWLFSSDVDYAGCRMERAPQFGQPPRCSGLIRNHAEGRGGAIFAFNGGTVEITDSFVLSNSSDDVNGAISHAFNSDLQPSPEAAVNFINTLIAENVGPNRGIYSGPGGFHGMRYSTIAGNELSAPNASVIRAFSNDDQRPGSFAMVGTIVQDDNARPMTSGGDFAGASLLACVIASGDLDDLNTPPGAVGFFSEIDDPEFLDPANGDYRLSQTSPAINYCDDSSFFLTPPVNRDLDQRPRDVVFPGPINDPPNPAPGRLYDLGAFVAFFDRIFSDRFE